MAMERYDNGEFLKLRKIDAALFSLCEKMNFLSITPNNMDAEKAKVFADPDYNPLFTYDDYAFDIDEMIKDANEINKHDSFMGNILEAKRKKFIIKCEMLRNRGGNKFSHYSRQSYGFPSDEIVKRARSLLNRDAAKPERTISTKRAIDLIRPEVTYYGFDYAVEAKEMSSSAAVLIGQKKIILKKNHDFSAEYMQQLILHEIGTHVLRAENGRLQPFKVFIHGFPDYLSTEEGLAVVNEERFGFLNADKLKKYAARTIAVQMAQTRSFSQIYRFMRQFFDEKNAFTLTLRAKRGISDTRKGGGCFKDYVYLDGYHKVKDYLASGGSIKNLYYGKIGVEHAKTIPKMQGISRPRYLPENQRFKSLLAFLR
ncbi:MAG: flavohemoglobin expression-modulating QEGLA motif protein [Nanoarchaeota archaeon]|nr:flavohemoglobin expression-modulating QEGLA motif protein [Nanoarchaeota archaeon]